MSYPLDLQAVTAPGGIAPDTFQPRVRSTNFHYREMGPFPFDNISGLSVRFQFPSNDLISLELNLWKEYTKIISDFIS